MKGIATIEKIEKNAAYAGSHESTDPTRNSCTSELKCVHCLKCFSSKHCLKEHYFTHTNERPYRCSICSKDFKHASQLSLHKKVHKLPVKLSWPKLTDLIKIEGKKTFRLEIAEKIEVPLIGEHQRFSLPRLEVLQTESCNSLEESYRTTN